MTARRMDGDKSPERLSDLFKAATAKYFSPLRGAWNCSTRLEKTAVLALSGMAFSILVLAPMAREERRQAAANPVRLSAENGSIFIQHGPRKVARLDYDAAGCPRPTLLRQGWNAAVAVDSTAARRLEAFADGFVRSRPMDCPLPASLRRQLRAPAPR